MFVGAITRGVRLVFWRARPIVEVSASDSSSHRGFSRPPNRHVALDGSCKYLRSEVVGFRIL